MDEQELKTLILNIRSSIASFDISGLEREKINVKLQKIEDLFKAAQNDENPR